MRDFEGIAAGPLGQRLRLWLRRLEGMKMNWKRVVPAVALLAMLVLATIAASPEVKGDSDRDAAIAEKWVAAWNSHSPDKMLPLYTGDVFYEDVAFGEVSHGSAELRKFAASEFEGVPDLEIKLQRAYVHGGHGTIEWIFSGTDKGVFKTGKKFSVRGVSVIDVRDGKISRSLDFYDVATMMRQVGLLPAQ
jgi:steroid delta-isomerase-like uncharacterized protein